MHGDCDQKDWRELADYAFGSNPPYGPTYLSDVALSAGLRLMHGDCDQEDCRELADYAFGSNPPYGPGRGVAASWLSGGSRHRHWVADSYRSANLG
jgi:hypothetical protein